MNQSNHHTNEVKADLALKLIKHAAMLSCSLLQKSWYPTPGSMVKFPERASGYHHENLPFINLLDSIEFISYSRDIYDDLSSRFFHNELCVDEHYLVASVNIKKEFDLQFMRYVSDGDIVLMGSNAKLSHIKWTKRDRIGIVGFVDILKEVYV